VLDASPNFPPNNHLVNNPHIPPQVFSEQDEYMLEIERIEAMNATTHSPIQTDYLST